MSDFDKLLERTYGTLAEGVPTGKVDSAKVQALAAAAKKNPKAKKELAEVGDELDSEDVKTDENA